MVDLWPASISVTHVRVTYEPKALSGCTGASREPEQRPAPEPRFVTLVLPALRAPYGLASRGSTSSGGGRNSVDASTRFDSTTMTPEALLAHYARQLVDAGWTSYSPAAHRTFSAQLFEARDELGRTWRGTLMVVPSGASRAISLTMSRPDDQ
jgi:hypothetical protein